MLAICLQLMKKEFCAQEIEIKSTVSDIIALWCFPRAFIYLLLGVIGTTWK